MKQTSAELSFATSYRADAKGERIWKPVPGYIVGPFLVHHPIEAFHPSPTAPVVVGGKNSGWVVSHINSGKRVVGTIGRTFKHRRAVAIARELADAWDGWETLTPADEARMAESRKACAEIIARAYDPEPKKTARIDPILSPMVQELRKQSLRHSVGRQIHCSCSRILDVSDAVEVTVMEKTSPVTDEVRNVWVFCGACFDSGRDNIDAAVEKISRTHGRKLHTEIIDGRAVAS